MRARGFRWSSVAIVATVASSAWGCGARTVDADSSAREPACGGYFPESKCTIERPNGDAFADTPVLAKESRALWLPKVSGQPTADDLKEGNAVIAAARKADPDQAEETCARLLHTYEKTGLVDALVPLAEACLSTGRTATAWQAIELFDSAPPSSSRTRPRDAARSARLREELAARVPKLTIDMPMEGTLVLDGKTMLEGPVRGTLYFSPGRHQLAIVGGPCAGATEAFIIIEGERKSFAVVSPRQ